VTRWRAFTGGRLVNGLTGDADDEVSIPSLGVIVELLPMPEAGDNYVMC